MKKIHAAVGLILSLCLVSGCDATSLSISNTTSATSVLPSSSSVTSSSVSLTASATANTSLITSVSTSTSSVQEGKDLFCSPSGKGTDGEGTQENPYTVNYAISLLQPGQTIYLLKGTYTFRSTVIIPEISSCPATKDKVKTMEAYNGEKVVFDFSSMEFESSNRGISVYESYWHLKDLEVQGAGDNGIYVGGNYITIEHCVVHDCQDTGIQLGRIASAYQTLATWPSFDTILNCTSYDNHDPSGEDSDGFACKLTTGIGNVFNGCISYNNVDDGYDFYTKGDTGPIGAITVKNCVAFNNGRTTKGIGTSNSDGNGFKLGGEGIPVSHVVTNCVAFNNLATGFTDNSNPGTISLTNCTSYNNGLRDSDANNIEMCRDEATSINNFKNILSYCQGNRTNPITGVTTIANSKDEYKGSVEHSVFFYGLTMLKFDDIQECDYTNSAERGEIYSSLTSPFVSLTVPDNQLDLHALLRNADGTVNLGDFLKVSPSSAFATMSADKAPIGAILTK